MSSLDEMVNKEKSRLYRNCALFKLLSNIEWEIGQDELGDWIFSDKDGPLVYGQGNTPEEALEDYTESLQRHLEINLDHLEDKSTEDRKEMIKVIRRALSSGPFSLTELLEHLDSLKND